jgi:uncharacterized membrane protein
MEFDVRVTAALFLGLIAVGVGALVVAPFMAASTVLMMVLPSMLVFGLICLGLGVKYGEHRAGSGV